MKKSPGIGRDGFEVAALCLRIKRPESQRRLSGSGDACKHHKRIAGNVERHIFEIVLPRSLHSNEASIGLEIRIFGAVDPCVHLTPSRKRR